MVVSIHPLDAINVFPVFGNLSGTLDISFWTSAVD